VAAYLRAPEVSSQRLLLETALVLSVHNLGYQGIFPPAAFALTGLPARYMEPLGPLEFWGRMNLMKGGLVLSDLLTTVSPTYARQIQESEEFGFGLQDVLRARGGDLLGILNGIDTRVWNPASDRLLPQTYDVERLEGKAACKRALQERLRLPPGPEVPLFGIISRLADQKGLDLVLQAAPELLAAGLQLVVLGSGQREYEVALQELARAHPRALAVQFAFDDALAHWIEAGCDFFLMPSRYEPCGLNQMYSLNYGTVPVVRRTGGLADTVTEWNPRTGEGNGFLFEPYRAEALVAAVRRALHAHGDAATMRRLRHAGMRADFSWRASARRYLEAYERAVVLRRGSARRTAG
jgi:starch synthase